MEREASKKYLQVLGQELQKKQVTGEILVADGVMVLLDIGKPPECEDLDAYRAYLRGEGPAIERRKDIDAYFGGHNTSIREAAASIASREGLPDEWLKEALQALYCTPPTHEKWLEYPGLRVYLSRTDYVLAMKIATANSPQDIEDIKKLVEKLHVFNTQELLTVISKYVPEQLLTPKMRQVVEQSFVLLQSRTNE